MAMTQTAGKLASHRDYNEIIGAARRFLAVGLDDPRANVLSTRQVVSIVKESYYGGLDRFLVDHGYASI